MPRRVAIFGSCVTRDIFNLPTPDFELVSYHARSSPVSVMSRSLRLAPTDLPSAAGFSHRMILADFNKTFFSEIRTAQPDIIIFDFAERFDLLRQGDAYATLSNDLRISGFDYSAHYRFEVINALSAAAYQLWKAASCALAMRLQAMLPGTRFVLHKAHWAHSYVDGDDLRLFDRATRYECTLSNLMLDAYYEHFVRQFNGIDVIQFPERYHAQHDHPWGLSPLHFRADCYHDALAQLRRIALAP